VRYAASPAANQDSASQDSRQVIDYAKVSTPHPVLLPMGEGTLLQRKTSVIKQKDSKPAKRDLPSQGGNNGPPFSGWCGPGAD